MFRYGFITSILIATVSVFPLIFSVSCNPGSDDSASDNAPESGDTGTSGASEIELITWWVNPGEADALQALLDVYGPLYPNVNVIDLSSVFGNSFDAWSVVFERVADGNPPDVFQSSPGDGFLDILNMESPGNGAQVLDDLFNEEAWGARYIPEIVDASTSADGHIYHLPISVVRLNTMFYNKSVVSEPPTTMDDFLAICEQLQQDGITPIAVSDEAWILGHVFKPMFAASAGVDFFLDYFAGAVDFSDEAQVKRLEKVLDDFKNLMKYTNGNSAGLEWQDAAQLLHDGEAAFLIHPSWAKGYLTSLGWMPDIDFGSAPLPNTDDLFIFFLDGFIAFETSSNPENGRNFLRVAGSEEAQSAFNQIKGQLPTYADMEMTGWDEMAKQMYRDMQNASIFYYAQGSPSETDSARYLDGWARELYTTNVSAQQMAQKIVNAYP